MTTDAKYAADDSADFYVSLTKLLESPIKDIVGYVSYEWEVPTFALSYIVLEDGRHITIGGEHDIAYLEANYRNPYPFKEALEVVRPKDW